MKVVCDSMLHQYFRLIWCAGWWLFCIINSWMFLACIIHTLHSAGNCNKTKLSPTAVWYEVAMPVMNWWLQAERHTFYRATNQHIDVSVVVCALSEKIRKDDKQVMRLSSHLLLQIVWGLFFLKFNHLQKIKYSRKVQMLFWYWALRNTFFLQNVPELFRD